MVNFSKWTIINSMDSGLHERHFNVIIREIYFKKDENIDMNKKLCFCGSGKRSSDCHADIADNTAMSYLFETFKLIDEDIEKSVPHPLCKKNCTECCNYSFEISAIEFFAILKYIQKNFSGLQTAVLKRKAVKELPVFLKIGDEINHIGEKFAPCLFLDNRKGCRIYEVRPLICRMYGYYSPWGNCMSVRDKIKFVPYEIDNRISKFLGDIQIGDFIKPPIAVPMIYWFGSSD